MSRNAGTLIKQSFAQRAKRLGLATTTTEQSSFITESELSQFRDCEFWRWDLSIDKHLELYKARKCGCFQCLIYWPVKNNVEHPIYPWQQEIFSALQSSKLIAILKARGVGASEFLLRYAFWLCVKDNQMRNKNMAVITGIREDLSLELLRRFRNLIPSLNWNTRENVAKLNGCRVIGYPSKRVKDLRGLTDVSFIMCDEFAFFDASDQQQLLPVLEAFQAKSDPTICLLSTPGGYDEFYNLYQEPAKTCRYHRLYIPIQKALGTLISEQETEKVRRQENYQQEFELRFGSHSGVGSIFNIADIDFAVKLGKEYATDPEYNPKVSKVPYPSINPHAKIHVIACDPGWGHSKTGISMIQLLDDRLHVVVAEEHHQPDEDEIIERLLTLHQKTQRPKQTKIYVDASNTSFIRRLKGCFPGERVDYENYIDELRKRRLIRPPDEAQIVHYMTVIPVSFSKFGAKMLATLYVFLSRGDIVIHPKFHTLIAALQSARNVPGRNSQFILDKTSSQSLDVLDSLRLCMYNFEADVPEFEEQEEEEEEEGEIITSS